MQERTAGAPVLQSSSPPARQRALRRARIGVLWLVAALGHAAHADALDRYIAQEARVYDLPAVVLGVIRDGRLVDTRVTGFANLELGIKANARHVFEIGSISKQFTAYAILILRDRGKVDLDAPVGRYLPELPEAWAKVSLHRLLTHSSGLPDLEEAFGYGIYRETPSDAEFLRRVTALAIEVEHLALVGRCARPRANRVAA